jgi:hypothetical protein
MSVYEELNGDVFINDQKEFDAMLETFQKEFDTHPSAAGDAVFASDEANEVYVRMDRDGCSVRVMVEENNHAVDNAAENSKLFKWATMTLAALKSSSGALHVKSEMADSSYEWVRYGR